MVRSPKCPECGAKFTVPSTGLTMTCQYCGFTCEVPDAARRRKQLRREEKRRREAERRAQARDKKVSTSTPKGGGRSAVLIFFFVALVLVPGVIIAGVFMHRAKKQATLRTRRAIEAGNRARDASRKAAKAKKLKASGFESSVPQTTLSHRSRSTRRRRSRSRRSRRLKPSVIQRVLKRRLAFLKNCTKGRRHTVMIYISRRGRVTKVRSRSQRADPEALRCLKTVLQRTRFPASSSKTVLSYSIQP